MFGLVMEQSKRSDKRKEKIKSWLRDPYNLALIGVLVFALIIRLYYFFLTMNQPLWWDEAVYGVLAKNFIVNTWKTNGLVLSELLIRPPIFPLVWAILMFFQIPEAGARFILEVIPSILTIFFVYLIGKEAFDKKTGVISAFIFSIIWVNLFYSMRLMTDMPSLFFLTASIYCFIKFNKAEEINLKYLFISLFLLSLGTLIRYEIGIVFLVYLISILFKTRSLITKPKFYLAGILGITPLLIFFLLNFLHYGNIFPSLLGGTYLKSGASQASPIAYNLLNYIPLLLGTVFFLFFLIGLLIVLIRIFLGYDRIMKNKDYQNYIFLLMILLFFFSFFIFYMRAAEDRYFLPASVILACFAGVGLVYIYRFIKKYNKFIAIILIFATLSYGSYMQIQQANQIIHDKIGSFLQIKQGAEWLEKNTPSDSLILGAGLNPYSIYYSDRDVVYYEQNETDKIDKVDYAIIHAFPPPTYLTSYIQEDKSKWVPIQAFFFDAQQTQPALIIYKNAAKN